MSKLPLEFYMRDDVEQIAKDLLGTYIYSLQNNILTGGKIVETEAYKAPEDKAHEWTESTRANAAGIQKR